MMKTRIVPSSELDPKKGLRAKDYMPKVKIKPRESVVYGVELKARYDCVGSNPRRCWLIYDKSGTFLRTVDTGLNDIDAVTELYPGLIALCSLQVLLVEYRKAMGKVGKDGEAVPS
jgi:hypothetical protein